MTNLIIISSCPSANASIINREETFNTTNKPFTRHLKIYSKLSQKYPEATYINEKWASDLIKKKIVTLPFIDSAYIIFLENAYKSFISCGSNDECTSPYDGGLVNYLYHKSGLPNNKKNIPYYLQCGIYGNDFCTSIFDYTYETALESAYNSIIAAKNIELNKIIYCCNIFPGHHAAPKLFSGYCFLNNTAICAHKLLEKYDRITILDLDYHHGDGTQKIFYEDSRVLTVSLHGDPINNYPFYTGYDNEHGEGHGDAYNYNYPLANGTSWPTYSGILSEALDMITEFNPDVLIVAFGADTYKDDPQGGFCLDLPDYQQMGQLIKKAITKPIIVTQEGGYHMESIDKIVCNFIDGLLEQIM